MPQIPVIDSQEATSTPLPSPRLSLQFHSSPWGQALGSLGQSVDSAVDATQRVQDKYDATAVANATNEFQQSINTAKYGSGASGTRGVIDDAFNGEQGGLTNQVGEQAVGGFDSYKQQLSDAQELAASKLASDRQKKLFEQHAQRMTTEALEFGEVHVSQQLKVARQATLNAGVSTAVTTAALDPYDEKAVQNEIDRVSGMIYAQSPSREAASEAVRQLYGEVRQQQLQGFIEKKDVVSAKKLLDDKTTQWGLGGKIEGMRKSVETLEDQVEAPKQARSLIDGASESTPGGLLHVDQGKLFVQERELAAKVPERRREIIRSEIERQVEDVRRANDQTMGDWRQQAYSQMAKSGWSLSAVDPQLLTHLRDEDRVGYEWLINAQRTNLRVRTPTPYETANEVAQELSITDQLNQRDPTIFAMSPQQFTKYASDHGVTTPEALRRVGETFVKMKDGKPGELPKPEAAAVQQLVTSELKLPSKATMRTPEQNNQMAHVIDYVSQQRAEFLRNNNGKEPTNEQLLKWAGEQFVKGRIEGSGKLWDDTKTRLEYETDKDYVGHRFIPEKGATTPPRSTDTVHNQPQAQKQLRSYRYTNDRKQRAPVFTDGSQGPLEPVNGGG